LTRRAELRVHPSCVRRCSRPVLAEAGQGGSVSLMSAPEFRHNVTIPAVPEQVRAVRDFVAGALGESRVIAFPSGALRLPGHCAL
jgi:hypothetical protein